MSHQDPNTHYFLNDWLQNRFLILNIGTTSAGKTYTTFRILDEMRKAKHPPSHLLFCTTSGGLDRTLRKQSKKFGQEIDFCDIEELPDKIQSIIAVVMVRGCRVAKPHSTALTEFSLTDPVPTIHLYDPSIEMDFAAYFSCGFVKWFSCKMILLSTPLSA